MEPGTGNSVRRRRWFVADAGGKWAGVKGGGDLGEVFVGVRHEVHERQ
jgi:hypothetical protein